MAQSKSNGDAIALITETGNPITYGSLSAKACVLASSLAQTGLRTPHKRPRFGLVLPNGSDIAIAMLGTSLAGEVAPFNPIFTAAEFEQNFKTTKIDALIVGMNDAGPSASVAHQMGLPVLRLTKSHTLAGIEPISNVPCPKPDDIALVLMTSGSTGSPKIVPLSHLNVCTSAQDVARSLNLGPDDRCLTMWEQFHIGGLVDLLLAPLSSGGQVIATSGFDAPKFYELMETYAPTWFQGVPTTLGELLRHAETNGITPRHNSFRFLRSVAAALSPAQMGRLHDQFGVEIVRTLGMTEAGPLITTTRLGQGTEKPGSVGRPAGPEVQIFSAEGTPLPTGAAGQIGIRGANVFSGYENNSEANEASFLNGWFLTGDNGYLDEDGDLFLTGRAKEMINRGGEKISPSEVDDALSAHPAVSETASFAVPHKTLGEDIVTAVVLRDEVETSALRAHLLGLVAAFKVPGRILVLDAMPRNPVGKIDKLILAQMAQDSHHSDTDHAAARNPTEQFLVSLWQQELSIPAVGIHQDFAAVGGDSLSAMRIMMAMETALQDTLPPAIFENFSTIATISDALIEAGFDTLGAAEEVSATQQAQIAFEQTSHGLNTLEGGAEAVMAALEASTDKDKFKAATDLMTAYETPKDILQLLEETKGAHVGSKASHRLGLAGRLKLSFRHWRWRADLAREITAAPDYALWQRQKPSESMLLYTDPNTAASGKTLICGFTGNLLRLFLPTYRILVNLDPKKYDLLMLQDRSRALFGEGLPEAGDTITSVADYVNTYAQIRGYSRVIALGTSGGGLGALYAAIHCKWSRVIAASAPSVNNHQILDEALREITSQPISPDLSIIIAHGKNERDTDPARQLLDMVPQASLQANNKYTSHNIMNDAYNAGEFPEMMADWFGDT